MPFDKAMDVSFTPGSYSNLERWMALIELQFAKMYDMDVKRRILAQEGIERLIWFGRS